MVSDIPNFLKDTKPTFIFPMELMELMELLMELMEHDSISSINSSLSSISSNGYKKVSGFRVLLYNLCKKYSDGAWVVLGLVL